MLAPANAKLAAPVIVKLLGALVIEAFARAIGGLGHNRRALPSFAVQKSKIYGVPCGPDALAAQLACSQRAAASALSSGRVLKAMTAPGAALCTALITASNIDRLWGGSRMPAPITTQS
jgi:hypothetical protein